MTGTVYADTTKVIYITRTDTTLGTRNANVDSLRNAIEQDPEGQLPGIWKMDLLNRADAETRNGAFWDMYDLVITWGAEEGGSNTYDVSIDQILDTIHKPVICRDGYVANGDPMWLGTTRIASLNVLNAPSHFRLDNTTHFITRNTYTDNANFGDSVALYKNDSSPNTDGLTGMSGDVQVLLRMAADRNNGDADSAVLVVLDSGATNTNGAAAPHRRAFVSINSSWRYCSWEARSIFFRTLRWAVGDTLIDTCVTKVIFAREAIDGSWLEYGIGCQGSYHYGATGTLRMGYEVVDRVPLVRIRSTAIGVQLPDTSSTKAYDVVDVKLVGEIALIADATAEFSWWQGLFEIWGTGGLWQDGKATIQLDSTCSSWNGSLNHYLSNNAYKHFPDYPWNSTMANTRGTDYSTTAYDSVWVQNPIISNQFLWNIPVAEFDTMRDSTTNKGMMIHTIGTTTGTAEIDMWSEERMDATVGIRKGMFAIATLVWRDANSASGDLDSVIAFNPDSLVFTGYENGANPSSRVIEFYNGASEATFYCDAVLERPAVSWLAQPVQGGDFVLNSVNISELTAGYYSTYLVFTCPGVSNSPDSAKVVLLVNPQPGVRQVGGKLKF